MPAPLTSTESERITLLNALDLFNPSSEPAFDRITQMAARLFNVPMVAVSLLDSQRQCFKSSVGLSVNQTPRENAFCAYTILNREIMVVNDTLVDPRFRHNPLVTSAPFIRFYAGAPLLSSEGIVLGTLCIIDTIPRVLTDAEMATLRDLAQIIDREIQQRESKRLLFRAYQHSRRLAQEGETYFRASFEQAGVGIAILDMTGKWVRINNKLCSIVGYSNTELMQLSFQDITHAEDLSTDLAYVERLLTGEINTYNMEKRYVRRDGSAVWINLTVSLLRDDEGQPCNFVTIIEDIQTRRTVEQTLSELRQNLEERVIERTQQLQQVNDLLLDAMQKQRTSETALRAREAQLSAILENAQDAFISIDGDGLIADWNPQAELTFGWSRDEAIGRPLDSTIIPPEFCPAHRAGMARYLSTGNSRVLNKRMEVNAMRRDGSIFPVEIRISPLPSETGYRFCAFLHDISERKANEIALQKSREQLRTIANNLPVQISYIDADLIVRFANAAYRDVGLAPEYAVGKSLAQILPADFYQDLQPHLHKALAGEMVNFEITTDLRQRQRIWHSIYIPDIQGDTVLGFHVMSQDITAQKQLEQSLSNKASRDALTGLPNRSALLERLEDAALRANQSNMAFAVLFLDLDGFKAINDCYGHDGGDKVLKMFAERLKLCVRETDMVARLAGDEFVILLEVLKNGAADAEYVAQKILRVMQEPLTPSGSVCQLTTSIGIHVATPGPIRAAEHLLKCADQAMYEAKRAGKSRIAFALAS